MFLDVDGTLLEFAPTPEGVVVPTALTDLLLALERRLKGALAFVSGRRISDLDRLFAPVRLPAAGVHGGEIRLAPAGETETRALAEDLPAAIFAEIEQEALAFAGVFTEWKRFSLAIHYRNSLHLKAALHAAIEVAVARHSSAGLQIVDGHLVLEVKTPGFHKGTGIAALMATPPFRGRAPVFIGDDVTDEDGFAFVSQVGGRAYSVSQPRGCATYVFPDPRAVRDWLASLVAEESAA